MDRTVVLGHDDKQDHCLLEVDLHLDSRVIGGHKSRRYTLARPSRKMLKLPHVEEAIHKDWEQVPDTAF